MRVKLGNRAELAVRVAIYVSINMIALARPLFLKTSVAVRQFVETPGVASERRAELSWVDVFSPSLIGDFL